MTEINESKVLEYLASCFTISVDNMPYVKLKLPTYGVNKTSPFFDTVRVSLYVKILGITNIISFKYSDWVDYENWDIKDLIIDTWGELVKNWILLKKLEILID